MPVRRFIAVVDDDNSVCKAVCRLLRTAGMTCAGYNSAYDFLQAARLSVPDCLILDITMPGLTGLALQELLVREGATFPIIFITAHADDVRRESALAGGAAAFLRKPFTDDVLLDAIQAALDRAGPPVGKHKPSGDAG